MTALFVVLMVVTFGVVDVLVRVGARRLSEVRARRAREALLETSLRLDFTHEAPSLRRVEVPHASARILVVDDEPIVLDSFRKVLALDGFSIDTVESGPEAVGLVQRRDYDFVFTDLKMPGMDGVEVVKAVRHLRPDVDVVVVTGYGTIESAVDTMQYGAVEYVQKPFTEDELLRLVKALLVRRQARLEAQRRPAIRVVPPPVADGLNDAEYCLPGGFFFSEGHTWMHIEPDGLATVGLDDFARKALRSIEGVSLPAPGQEVQRGESLFTVREGARRVSFTSPLGGTIVRVNEHLQRHPSRVITSPYDQGWICALEPGNLAQELSGLRIGQHAVGWYQQEVARWRAQSPGATNEHRDDAWRSLERDFLRPAAAAAS